MKFHTIIPVISLVCLAQPEIDMAIIQKWQTEGHSQQVEEVVVARQNDEDLKQHLHEERKQTDFILELTLKLIILQVKLKQNVKKFISFHLQVKSSKSEPPQWTEEQERNSDLDNEGSHHAQLLPAHRQLVGKPGQRGWDTLSLVVIREGCSTHSKKRESNQMEENDRMKWEKKTWHHCVKTA